MFRCQPIDRTRIIMKCYREEQRAKPDNKSSALSCRPSLTLTPAARCLNYPHRTGHPSHQSTELASSSDAVRKECKEGGKKGL